MVTYEVTATVESALIEDFERYMRERHVPAILATGCFQGAVLTRSAPGRYRMRYEAAADADLQRYLVQHATRLREDFTLHFPSGVAASREVWVAIETWNSGSG